MTYRDTWIEEARTGPAAEKTSRSAPVLGLLRASVSLDDVRRWAEDGHLEIKWLDNGWIRVPVTAQQVLDFLGRLPDVTDEEFAGNHDRYVRAVEVASRIRPERHYVIVAEDF